MMRGSKYDVNDDGADLENSHNDGVGCGVLSAVNIVSGVSGVVMGRLQKISVE